VQGHISDAVREHVRAGKRHAGACGGWLREEAERAVLDEGRTERELLELASHTMSTLLPSPAPGSQPSSAPTPTEEKPPVEPSEAVEPPPISDEPPT